MTDYEARQAKRDAALARWQNARSDLYAALVAGVRAHAQSHYDAGGWDVICEAWEDEQIRHCIGYAGTVRGAVAKVAVIVSIYADRQADARNSAF